MLILPYNADLRLAIRPYVTYAVMALCIVIFTLQLQSEGEVEQAIEGYCEQLVSEGVEAEEADPLDLLRDDYPGCYFSLTILHSQPNRERGISILRNAVDVSEEEQEAVLERILDHYDDFAATAPQSLTRRLQYDPASWNPLTMVTAALAHGGFFHILGNLIAFLAFATTVEVILGRGRFIAVLLALAFITHISYSLSTLGGAPIPSLGLSGVVMGMIGIGGFLMPQARIRTFIWFLTVVRTVSIPAWTLALWYIGWDSYNLLTMGNGSGVNLVAHVSGGLGGYLIGRLLFNRRKEEIREELDEEIEHMRSERTTHSFGSTSRAGQQRIVDQRRQHQAKQEFSAYVDRLHRLVTTSNHSDAVLLLVERYPEFHQSVEIYEDLFEQMGQWGKGRTLLCLGRLTISLLLAQKQWGRALAIAEQCLAIAPEFLLSRGVELAPLVEKAMAAQRYPLAYGLIRNAPKRYTRGIDPFYCRMVEAKLLLLHLGQPEKARPLIEALLRRKDSRHFAEVEQLARCLE